MWLNIALMTAILHQCYCMDIDCNDIFPETPYGELECSQEEIEYQNKEVRSCNVVDITNVVWTVMNSTAGTLSVEFDLMSQSCANTLYMLYLYISDNVTSEEECYNNTFLLHSKRRVKILNHVAENNGKVSPCGKTAVVTFNYIFTGCYVLDVKAEKFGINNCTEPKFIETEYKKDLLIDKKPTIITQPYITAPQELQFSVGNITRINVTRMDLEIRKPDSHNSTCGHGIKQHWWEMALSQIDVSVQFQSIEDLHIGLHLNSDIDQTKDQACYVSGHEHSCCTYRSSGQFMCKMRNHLSNKPSCHVDSDMIRCTIHNVTTGFYCVLVEIFDDRCERGTVWNNNSYCRYNSKIIKIPTSPQDAETLTPAPSQAAFDAILVAVVLAVVLVCLCVLVLFCRRRRRRSIDSGGSCYVTRVAVPHRPRILLLYARDCELFMNMMTTFRQVLKEVTMCEVYDCFDPVAAEELCQNKTDWLLTRISSPDVKVVLVESKCAVLQQMALMQHMKVIYKDPTWLDDLFLYGLRVLLEDLQTNVYERVFVVCIHGFTEEDVNLCHITPYTRYVVPQNTENLLSSLYQESALEHVVILKEDSDSSVQRLQDNIRMLQVFKQQNGDYLNKLLETAMKECD